jgi:hypothetical protein
MGYFKAPRKAKIKGAGLYFHWHPFRVCEVLDVVSGGIAVKRGGPFLADCLSGFPAFAENDGRNGALTRTIVTLAGPFLFFVFQEWLGREAQEVLSGSTM